MDLGDFYPDADELLNREVAVLDFLRNAPFIKEHHSQFAQDAATYFGRNKGTKSGFEFFSYLDVSHDQKRKEKPNLRLIVAARIERQAQVYHNVTYCLGVCRIRTLSVLRKFHFDITIGNGSNPARSQPHPMCHMQYCGEMIPQMQSLGVRESQLEIHSPWLSEPRILVWPMSLALLLDMTLHEFPNPRSEKFRATPEWRAIVRAHENLLLKPFLERCLEVIVDSNGHRRTLADAFYVG